MTQNAISVYDLSLSLEHNTFETIKKVLSEWCTKWCFQKEKADAGYEHWQLRFSLTKKRRHQEIAPRLAMAGLKFHDSALSPTSTSGVKTGFSYVMKADTRIEGPWADTDVERVELRCVKYLEEHGLEPWMDEIVTQMKTWDHRFINVFIDKTGNCGKTTFEDYLEYKELAFPIWYDPNIARMSECAFANVGRTAYTIGLPKALNKKEMTDFWNFVERLKDGRVQDGRFKFKRARMERPHVWIFTNEIPRLHEMSMDRWKFWQKDETLGGLCTFDEFIEGE